MVSGVNGNYYTYTVKRGDNLTKIANANNTTVADILKLNPNLKINDVIHVGDEFVLPDNNDFIQRDDYSPNNLNMNGITINGESVDGFDKSNFYANNLSSIAQNTINDTNTESRVEVLMQAGKTMTRKDNDTPFSILNKVIGDHIYNSSTIIKDNNNIFHTKNQWLEDTDLYQIFISEDVNGDNFTGEGNRLLSRGNSGNRVQLPSIEVDSQGVKYFTLQGNNKTYYFDETGKEVQFYQGKIIEATKRQSEPTPQPRAEDKTIETPATEEFNFTQQNNDKILNFGNFYINGKPVVKPDNTKANFFANNINMFTDATLNDDSTSSRLDLQLNAGNMVDDRDRNADDLLKKMLGINWNKTSNIVFDDNGQAQAVVPSLKDTKLYHYFLEVNKDCFVEGKIKKGETLTVQFPALETDGNGGKYYTLHTKEGILYFNDKGEKINN